MGWESATEHNYIDWTVLDADERQESGWKPQKGCKTAIWAWTKAGNEPDYEGVPRGLQNRPIH